MATKSATVLVRIEPDIKKKAEAVLNNLGVTPSIAVNAFYRQIILNNGFPFEIKKTTPNIPKLDKMTKADILDMIQECDSEIASGEYRPAEEVFAKLHAEYNA